MILKKLQYNFYNEDSCEILLTCYSSNIYHYDAIMGYSKDIMNKVYCVHYDNLYHNPERLQSDLIEYIKDCITQKLVILFNRRCYFIGRYL